jgi:predicted Rossmann-fold nucleotide-binding protein
MEQMIEQRFMNPQHHEMWTLVDAVDAVLPAIRSAPRWREDARNYAVVRS